MKGDVIKIFSGALVGALVVWMLWGFTINVPETDECPGGCYASIEARNYNVLNDPNMNGTERTMDRPLVTWHDCMRTSPDDMCMIGSVDMNAGVIYCICWRVS